MATKTKPSPTLELEEVTVDLLDAEVEVTRLRARQKRLIVEGHKAGVSQADLARATELSRQRIHQLLNEEGK